MCIAHAHGREYANGKESRTCEREQRVEHSQPLSQRADGVRLAFVVWRGVDRDEDVEGMEGERKPPERREEGAHRAALTRRAEGGG